MIKLGRQVSGSELDRIMRFIDEDRSGEIELNEFREWWRMETDPENKNPTTKPAPADAAEAVRQRFPKRRPSDQKGGSARLATARRAQRGASSGATSCCGSRGSSDGVSGGNGDSSSGSGSDKLQRQRQRQRQRHRRLQQLEAPE